jgi:hypothetical protein
VPWSWEIASMSSAPVSPTVPSTPPGDAGTHATDKIIVYRHSHLFYWWPIWFLGFLFAAITYFDNKHLAIVPEKTIAVENQEVEIDGKKVKRDILILDEGKSHLKRKVDDREELVNPTIYVSHFRVLGSIYVIALLIVITITNVAVRGLWTVLVVVSIIMLAIILLAGGWWSTIFEKVNQLSIYINMGAYLLISIVLFILWTINFAFFDRQTYMVFTPGQVRVRIEIGGEETVYDTTGMVVQKQRSDMFRHWILGFGSGDLIIKPVGVAHPIAFDNVMGISSKLVKIETMIKEKVILKDRDARPA